MLDCLIEKHHFVQAFLKNESGVSSTYQYGLVDEVEVGRDGKVRKVRVKYRNASEKTDRTTYRAVRSLVLIRRADESSIMEELVTLITLDMEHYIHGVDTDVK